MTIVGHKIERYLTAERTGMRAWQVTHHQVVTELHATKGWRPVRHERKLHTVARLPPIAQWRAADITAFVWKDDFGPREHRVKRLKVCP